MSRLRFTRASVISSVTVALVVAACSSDDAKHDSSGNNAGNGTSGTTSNSAAGPTTNGTTAGTTGAANNSSGPTSSVTGNGAGPTTTGTSGGNPTTTTSAGGTSAANTTIGTGTTQGTTGIGGTGGGGNNPIAGTDSYDCSAPEGEIPALTLTEVVGGIEVPVDIEHSPNDDRLFVISLSGDVHIIKDGALVGTPFLSLGNKVIAGGAPGDERGLLGIAFHPAYAENGLFYLHYSAGTGVPGASTSDTVIEEYHVSSDPDIADAASARVVLTVEQPDNGNAAFQNHKGGSINFGPDGLLYIGLGDGGGTGDNHQSSGSNFAQDTSRLLGKILRIDPLGGDSYSTPADNLVQDVSGAAPEIWDYGLRNPFRRTFDACTGDMYIGDVGQDAWEEITIEKLGEGRKNYGWNILESLHCYPNGDSCNRDGITLPLIEVGGTTAESITGGSVYRGSSIPSLRGVYFYADYARNNVWYTRYDRDAHSVSTPTSVAQELNANSIVAIKNGNDGELYFVSAVDSGGVTASLGQGTIYKLTAAQ